MKEKLVVLFIWAALLFCILRVESAMADTVTLTPETCTYLNPATGVCSDAGLVFSSSVSTLMFDGVTYTGGGFPDTGDFEDEPFYADDGSLVLLTAVITPHAKYISVGRSRYFKHWFTLDSGSVTTP